MFRKNFLKPDTIASIPHGGYHFKERFSIIACKWLQWEAQERGVRIQHARNGGEAPIGPYKVDGLVEGTNHVLEFHGCL